MRHSNQWHAFARIEGVARFGTYRYGGCGARRTRCGAGALYAGVHVGLIVVADIEHIVVAVESA